MWTLIIVFFFQGNITTAVVPGFKNHEDCTRVADEMFKKKQGEENSVQVSRTTCMEVSK